jgi:hypothetical protein
MTIRNRARIIVCMLACGGVAGRAYAQAPQTGGLVIKGGLASATLQSGLPGAADRHQATGFSGGVALTLLPYESFGLQTELLLTERHQQSAASSAPLVVVPFLLRARLADLRQTRISLLAGPEVVARVTRGPGAVQQSYDYGMDLGLDIDVPHRTIIDVRYTRGLVNLGNAPDPTESRTHGLTVMVGWRLH